MASTVSMKHSTTGEIRPAVVGFSWTSVFFGFFVPLFRGDFWYVLGVLLAMFVAIVITEGIGSILIYLYQAFTYNKRGIRRLSEKGFMPADESSMNLLKAHGIVFENNNSQKNDS